MNNKGWSVASPSRSTVFVRGPSFNLPRRLEVSVSVHAGAQASVLKDMSSTVTLDNIRSALIRQEDTIIFNLIERAQFARNQAVYKSGGVPVPGFDRTGRQYPLLEYVLRETENLHGKIRRYTSPDEHAFYPDDLPPLVLPPIQYPNVLAPCAQSININEEIMLNYLNNILPAITAEGEDFNYGSTACLDIACLQALSKRIHYGKFVAEAKFLADPDSYSALIRSQDAPGLMVLLTDELVERKVVERVRLKAMTFGQDIGSHASDGEPVKYKLRPEVVAEMYETFVMPLTKEVQVAYLLRRLDDPYRV